MSSLSTENTLLQTLRSLSAHLDGLAGQVFEVEEALSDFLSAEKNTDHFSITKFQTLDFARQSLEDCALLLHLVSDENLTVHSSTTPLSEIAQKLKLDATKRLLSKTTRDVAPASEKPGEIDLL